MGSLAILALAFFYITARPSYPELNDPEKDPRTVQARTLLDEGKYEQAMLTYPEEWQLMNDDLLERINKTSDPAKGAQLCEAYLNYYPFGNSKGLRFQTDYSQAVTLYIRFIKKLPPRNNPVVTEDLAAEGDWVELARLSERDARLIQEKASAIVQKFPHSHFALAAAICASKYEERRTWHSEPNVIHEACTQPCSGTLIELLSKQPSQTRPRTLTQAREAFATWKDDHSDEFIEALHQAAIESTSLPEKYQLLVRAASRLQENNIEKSRAYVDESLRVLRQLQSRGMKDVDWGPPIFSVAVLYMELDKTKAMSLLDEIINQNPTSSYLGSAHLAKATLYRASKDAPKMEQEFKMATETSQRLDRWLACELLGEFYMERSQWGKALPRWWTLRPYHAGKSEYRSHNIRICCLWLGLIGFLWASPILSIGIIWRRRSRRRKNLAIQQSSNEELPPQNPPG